METNRCVECFRTSAQVTRDDGPSFACISEDALGRSVCGACAVPDITLDRYQGSTDDFIVAPPNAKNVTPIPELELRALAGDR